MNKTVGYSLISAAWMFCSAASAFDLDRAAAESGMSQEILRAIALQESRIRDPETGLVRPWPWVLGTPEGSYWYEDRQSATRGLREFLAKGYRNIDVGAFQLNLRWHSDLVDHPEDLLDPAVNLWAAVQVLHECRNRFGGELASVIGCYHAGDPKKRHGVRYAGKVLALAQRIKE